MCSGNFICVRLASFEFNYKSIPGPPSKSVSEGARRERYCQLPRQARSPEVTRCPPWDLLSSAAGSCAPSAWAREQPWQMIGLPGETPEQSGHGTSPLLFAERLDLRQRLRSWPGLSPWACAEHLLLLEPSVRLPQPAAARLPSQFSIRVCCTRKCTSSCSCRPRATSWCNILVQPTSSCNILVQLTSSCSG